MLATCSAHWASDFVPVFLYADLKRIEEHLSVLEAERKEIELLLEVYANAIRTRSQSGLDCTDIIRGRRLLEKQLSYVRQRSEFLKDATDKLSRVRQSAYDSLLDSRDTLLH